MYEEAKAYANFNPRSLAGATDGRTVVVDVKGISIHAPSRERRQRETRYNLTGHFNPRSLAGATAEAERHIKNGSISIHAPSRERPSRLKPKMLRLSFQSTLPRGSDSSLVKSGFVRRYFNPRSLAGATYYAVPYAQHTAISIHAPSRERLPHSVPPTCVGFRFQSTLPRGSDQILLCRPAGRRHFNPRSLAGATSSRPLLRYAGQISIHAPSRERRTDDGDTHADGNFNPRSLAGATRT